MTNKDIKILKKAPETSCSIHYNGRPHNYRVNQIGFEKYLGSKDIEKLQTLTDEYVNKMNELLDEGKNGVSGINLEVKIKPFEDFIQGE